MALTGTDRQEHVPNYPAPQSPPRLRRGGIAGTYLDDARVELFDHGQGADLDAFARRRGVGRAGQVEG